MKLAIISDEISRDFDTAVEIGTSWGIRNFEVRMTPSGRVPRITDADRKQLLAVRKKYGITVSSISPGFFKDPLESDAVAEGMKEGLPKAFDLARELGTQKVVVFGFLKPKVSHTDPMAVPGRDYPSAVVDKLGEMVAAAEKADVILYLENEPVCWGDTGLTTAEIIRKVGSARLRMNWDPGNACSSGATPFPDEHMQIKDLIGHTHIKDIKRTATGRQVVPVGEGDVDWRGVLKQLYQDGYDGYYTIETHFGPKVQASKRCVDALTRMLLEVL